jgi:hypothetical protein
MVAIPRTPRRTLPRNIYYDRRAHSVVVTRRGRLYSGHFSDGVWGGRAQSRIAAQRWLYALLKDIDPDTRVRQRPPKGSLSKTGIVGVSLETYRVDGRPYQRYVAKWQGLEKGSQKRRFSVSRYGRNHAQALAREARKAGVARYEAQLSARQREEAARHLRQAPPQPRQIKDPLSRKGISMAARRPRGTRPAAAAEPPADRASRFSLRAPTVGR